METKANYVLIGFFTLVVLAGAFGFVHWFRNHSSKNTRAVYNVVFQGSVGGLRKGATVEFNGMRVGEVADLQLDQRDPKQVLATISIDSNVPIRSDTHVRLEFAGLTGVASVELKGGDPQAGPLAEGADGVPTIIADAGATQDLSSAARELIRKLDALVAEDSSLHNSIANIEAFTVSLKNNADRFDRIMAGLEGMTGTPDKPGELVEAVKSIRLAAANLDKRIDEMAPGLAHFTGPGLKNLEALIADARRAVGTAEVVFRNIDQNPSRLLFGGAPASAPAAASPVRRQQPQQQQRATAQ
jgi:phospholipid/cholesterol/gamma-HCH transport system substrate-binding protein